MYKIILSKLIDLIKINKLLVMKVLHKMEVIIMDRNE